MKEFTAEGGERTAHFAGDTTIQEGLLTSRPPFGMTGWRQEAR